VIDVVVLERSGASDSTAKDLADALTQLDEILRSHAYDDLEVADVTALRARVRRSLVSIRTDLGALAQLDADDVFKTNPVFATQKYQLITNIEQTKIDFEFEIAPALHKLACASLERARMDPTADLDTEVLSARSYGDGWTVDQVLDSAQKLVDTSTKAVGIISKAGALISALGLLAGVVPH
jgi:hypothetical protein